MRLKIMLALSTYLFMAATVTIPAMAQDRETVDRLLQEGVDQYQAGLNAFSTGDYSSAMEYWRPLAEKGSVDAQNNLGYLYANGLGVPQDYAQAREWYQQSAAQKNASGQHNLGLLYARGLGTSVDHKEALKWHERAADQLYPQAVRSLAIAHYHGRGVPQDHVKAYMWFQVAADLGHPTAAQSLALIKRELNDEEVTRANEAAKTWLGQRSP